MENFIKSITLALKDLNKLDQQQTLKSMNSAINKNLDFYTSPLIADTKRQKLLYQMQNALKVVEIRLQ